jgi:hydroxymethylpyrimidine/phosphomethylpyrimidine kinase
MSITFPRRRALSIAGSDSGGGAGIQADLKTFQELGVFGMTAITAVTAQNTLGVSAIYPLDAEAVHQQMEAVLTDIGADACKTGMLFDDSIIGAVAAAIRKYAVRQFVLDPVMIAKGGAPLLQPAAIAALRSQLIPLARIVTPNIPEAEALTGTVDMEEAARILHGLGAVYVVIKGGHDEGDSVTDLCFDGTHFERLICPRIATRNTHGTGCTFSAAICANLAGGMDPMEAIRAAKAFTHAAIEHALELGGGHGPTNHWAYMSGRRTADGGRR